MLGACGGDDEESATVTETEPVETATEPTETEATETEAGASREAFETLLRQNLVEEQGLTEEQADCAIEKIQDRVSDKEIQQITTGELTPKVRTTLFEVGVECGKENP